MAGNRNHGIAKFTVYRYLAKAMSNSTQIDGIVPMMPIGCGCYPDPSILHVGKDYYIVNSSFAFYPGVPIWHSTDMKTWERLGFVLNRPSQLQLPDSIAIRSGIYAPQLSYNPNNGLYYMITTAIKHGGNFYVTTSNPKSGIWSDPVWLPEIGGIDPSFFFDEDGKAYIVHNGWKDQHWKGHCNIYCMEFDAATGKTIGKDKLIVYGGVDTLSHPKSLEGPHMYKQGGRYLIMAAEGGTSTNHSVVVFEAKNPMDRYKPCPINPILTQRDAEGSPFTPITSTGHADLVKTDDGKWYAVFFGVRPYA